MSEVIIRNQEILKMLDDYVNDFRSVPNYNDEKYARFSSRRDILMGTYYCSDHHLEVMRRNPEEHSGFPEQHYAQPIARMKEVDPEIWGPFADRSKGEIVTRLGAHTSALANFYPKHGYVGWHTNWNANGYQVLFTWSENGNGYFRYLDNETGKIVTIEDVPGWQCRHFYFGSKEEVEHHCWHAAYTSCERMTLAYKFTNDGIGSDKDKIVVELRDQLIEEIENDDF